jgi:hypothetical protein
MFGKRVSALSDSLDSFGFALVVLYMAFDKTTICWELSCHLMHVVGTNCTKLKNSLAM